MRTRESATDYIQYHDDEVGRGRRNSKFGSNAMLTIKPSEKSSRVRETESNKGRKKTSIVVFCTHKNITKLNKTWDEENIKKKPRIER